MNKKVIAIVGGGCLLVLLCAVCLVGVYVFAAPQMNQLAAMVGAPSSSNDSGSATSPSTIGGATALPLPTAGANVPSQASTPQASGGNPADAIAKAFQGWGTLKSFRAHMTMGASGAGAQDIEMEVVTPDRFHMTMKGIELIVIGNTSYVKAGPTWIKTTSPQAIDLSLADPKKFQAEIGATPDIKFVGPDVLDGTPTLVYQVSASASGGAQPTKIWVGATDGLPRKIVTVAGTITFSDFNSNISINAPVP